MVINSCKLLVFVLHKIRFYQFCGFSYFVMMHGVYSDNGSIFLQFIGFGHPSKQPYNPCTLLRWLDLWLELMVNSMVLEHTSTQITCINNNMYFQLVNTLPSPSTIERVGELPTPWEIWEPNPLILVSKSIKLFTNENVGNPRFHPCNSQHCNNKCHCMLSDFTWFWVNSLIVMNKT
jgi:hypothetical protein